MNLTAYSRDLGTGQRPDNPLGWTPPATLLELAADDDGLIHELVAAFREDTGIRIQVIRTALSTADLTRLRAEVHTIKGSSRQVGAEVLANICQDIELAAQEVPIGHLTDRVDLLEMRFQEISRAMARHCGKP